MLHKPQPSNDIIPSTTDLKEFQIDEMPPTPILDNNRDEQMQTIKEYIKNNNSPEAISCACWKDVARILDKIFFALYTFAIVILRAILLALFYLQEYPELQCNKTFLH